MIKRLLDVLVSLIGIILLSPLFIVVSILIKCDSRGSVFFRQARVGRNNKDFVLYKFRSMHHQDWGKDQLLTVGDNDPRITRLGRWLRQLKIDEQECPEVYFKEVIMPKKIELNLEYVKHHSFIGDVKILLRTAYLTIFDR